MIKSLLDKITTTAKWSKKCSFEIEPLTCYVIKAWSPDPPSSVSLLLGLQHSYECLHCCKCVGMRNYGKESAPEKADWQIKI